MNVDQDVERVVSQIDTIIRQLELLRRELTDRPHKPSAPGLTRSLFGAAGQGTEDEYDLELDWARFSEWPRH
jgi:hypothetical protein